MEKYLFIVRNHEGITINALAVKEPNRLMQTAHGLIDAFCRFGADRCEIWMRTDHHKMVLLGTAF